MALLKDDRKSAQPQDKPDNARPIGVREIFPLGLLVRQPDKQQEQQDCADWHIDEKGIVPAQVLGQPAADQWPHHGAKNHSHAEQGHSDWLLVRR